jgi:hypothetical protein
MVLIILILLLLNGVTLYPIAAMDADALQVSQEACKHARLIGE